MQLFLDVAQLVISRVGPTSQSAPLAEAFLFGFETLGQDLYDNLPLFVILVCFQCLYFGSVDQFIVLTSLLYCKYIHIQMQFIIAKFFYSFHQLFSYLLLILRKQQKNSPINLRTEDYFLTTNRWSFNQTKDFVFCFAPLIS